MYIYIHTCIYIYVYMHIHAYPLGPKVGYIYTLHPELKGPKYHNVAFLGLLCTGVLGPIGPIGQASEAHNYVCSEAIPTYF